MNLTRAAEVSTVLMSIIYILVTGWPLAKRMRTELSLRAIAPFVVLIILAVSIGYLFYASRHPNTTIVSSDKDPPNFVLGLLNIPNTSQINGEAVVVMPVAVTNTGNPSPISDWKAGLVGRDFSEQLTPILNLGIAYKELDGQIRSISPEALLTRSIQEVRKNQTVTGFIAFRSSRVNQSALTGGTLMIKFRDNTGRQYQIPRFFGPPQQGIEPSPEVIEQIRKSLEHPPN